MLWNMFKINNKNTKATSLMSRDGMLYGPRHWDFFILAELNHFSDCLVAVKMKNTFS